MSKQFLSIHVDIPIPLRSDWAEADRTLALLRGFADAIEAAMQSQQRSEEAETDKAAQEQRP